MPENNPDNLIKRLKAEQLAIKQQVKVFQEQVWISSQPRVLARQNDISDPRNIGIIYQWDDGDGNIIYTASHLGTSLITSDAVRPLAARISTQRVAFTALDVAEQSRIRSEFASSRGKSVGVQPYQDLLRSEAVGKRFEAIKQQRAVKR